MDHLVQVPFNMFSTERVINNVINIVWHVVCHLIVGGTSSYRWTVQKGDDDYDEPDEEELEAMLDGVEDDSDDDDQASSCNIFILMVAQERKRVSDKF